jgi:hypothetical protein
MTALLRFNKGWLAVFSYPLCALVPNNCAIFRIGAGLGSEWLALNLLAEPRFCKKVLCLFNDLEVAGKSGWETFNSLTQGIPSYRFGLVKMCL